MKIDFVKMHGTGNDFVMIDDMEGSLDPSTEQIAYLCDRHFGVGADGVILVRPPASPEAEAFMLYYNADGSLVEMCGNGVRCFTKFVIDRAIVTPRVAGELAVDTRSGIKPVSYHLDDAGLVDEVTVDMGSPILEPDRIPVAYIRNNMNEPLIDEAVSLPFGEFSITCVSMGNPHCVIFVDDPKAIDVETIGPLMETSALFPNKTNVEFASVSGNHIFVRTWERGVGETLACGTGACATAVAGALSGKSGRDVTVDLLGGPLQVRWAADDHVIMTGPATCVFSGEISL